LKNGQATNGGALSFLGGERKATRSAAKQKIICVQSVLLICLVENAAGTQGAAKTEDAQNALKSLEKKGEAFALLRQP